MMSGPLNQAICERRDLITAIPRQSELDLARALRERLSGSLSQMSLTTQLVIDLKLRKNMEISMIGQHLSLPESDVKQIWESGILRISQLINEVSDV